MRRRRDRHHAPATGPHRKPYVLITTQDPEATLGEGVKVRYGTMLEAANAFSQSTAPCKAIVFDNGHLVRELNRREEKLLRGVCWKFGLEVVDG